MANFKVAKSGMKTLPTWLYPQVVGCNPSERWGHSACFSDGMLYVFGGCCGGLHFSDVLTLDLKRMTWSSLVTTGLQPGTRDSHSATLVGGKMVVFGGTNGSKKINDLHILDLETRNWSQPLVEGRLPAPRESHSATLVGDNKLVVFAGSGEGEGNYLNDLHILDINAMRWTSPEVKGEYFPTCRDSHTAVSVGNRLVVYGGDSGDHYLGEVDIFDLDNFCWSKMEPVGLSSPGVRAGHASVAVNNKVYIIGGVGDRAYYNDVWTLDIKTRTWTRLDVSGQQPQGRFSHSAVLADSNITVYGGCGEDEHPLDEIIILHLGSDGNNGLTLPTRKISANACPMEHRRLSGFRRVSGEVMNDDGPTDAIESSKKDKDATILLERAAGTGGQNWKDNFKQDDMKKSSEFDGESKLPTQPDNPDIAKKRKILLGSKIGMDVEQEEQSHSLSQQSSPSLSDQEQTIQKRSKVATSHAKSMSEVFLQQPLQDSYNQQKLQTYPFLHQFPVQSQHANIERLQKRMELHQPQQQQQKMNNLLISSTPSGQLKMRVPHYLSLKHGNMQAVQDPHVQSISLDHALNAPDAASKIAHHKRVECPVLCDKQQRVAVSGILAVPNLVGAEVRGIVDAVFDSGYLMTAQVNAQVFRGLLFNPGPTVSIRETNMVQSWSYLTNNHENPGIITPAQTRAQNPTCMNGAILGAPALSGLHIAPLAQPVNRNGSVSPGYAMENPMEGAPHLGLVLKSPGSSVSEMPCQLLVCNRAVGPVASLESTRAAVDEVRSTAPPSQTPVAEGENCGLAQVVFPGSGSGGQWVWHPFPPSAPIASPIPLDQHSSTSRRDTVHFVAVPPFSGFNLAPSLNHHEMQPCMVDAGSFQVESAPSVGDPRTGITLSLGQASTEHINNNISTRKC